MPFVLAAVESRVDKLREKLDGMRCKSDVLRESVAEFLGTFLLVLCGNSVTAVITFTGAKEVAPLLGPLGWGLALLLSICVTGGVSGTHVNPAVTVALASVGKCPWRKVVPFVFAQYAGAFVSAIVLYAVYFESFAEFDAGVREMPPHDQATAQIFATFPAQHVGALSCFVDQVVSTLVLQLAVSSLSDQSNLAVPKHAVPLTMGLVLVGVITAFPANCGAPLNPARDLGPRLFTAVAGWGGEVFSFRDYNYFWVPVLGPHVGALLGAWAYRLLVEMHWPLDASYDFPPPTEVKAEHFKHIADKKVALRSVLIWPSGFALCPEDSRHGRPKGRRVKNRLKKQRR